MVLREGERKERIFRALTIILRVVYEEYMSCMDLSKPIDYTMQPMSPELNPCLGMKRMCPFRLIS